MVILASIVLALGGIVWWCSGSWAARVVATVLLVPFCAYGVGGIVALLTAPNQLSAQAVAGIILGGICGWLLAGLPQRYGKRREDAIMARYYALTVQPSLRGSTEIIQRDVRA
jgi:predicted membrane protein